jgi:chromosome transmission fidelity protein 4
VDNLISFTTSDGEVFIYKDFIPQDYTPLLDLDLQPAPFVRDPLAESSGNVWKSLTNGINKAAAVDLRQQRRGTPDSLDDILGSDPDGEEDGFVVDDDGAGYALGVNKNGKRTNGYLDELNIYDTKRKAIYGTWRPRLHEPFQPGSTPWSGNRRYLCRYI